MTQEEFNEIVNRIHKETKERELSYVFPKKRVINVEEAYDREYAYAKLNLKEGDRDLVFIGLNPARDKEPKVTYTTRKEDEKKKGKLDDIVTGGSAWYRAVKHSELLEKSGINSIYFLDVCATGTLKAANLKGNKKEEYIRSIDFISKYLKEYLPNVKIILCTGGKTSNKAVLKAIYYKLIKENMDNIWIYGLVKSGFPKHINGNSYSKLHLIEDNEIQKIVSKFS